MPGRLIVCATPIGNLGDVPRRLGEVVATADVVYAEDTRRSAVLLEALGVGAKLRSFFVGNERVRADELERELRAGSVVALLTDAGTPAVADPGTAAVAVARRVGAEVSVVPGPSAVTAAVAVAGMGGDRFCFEGFLPRKGAARSDRLTRIATSEVPVVVFSSPHRLADDLADLADVCGPGREVCVARELTKLHEEVWWGSLSEAVERWTAEAARGEFTLVISAAEEVSPTVPVSDAVEAVSRLVASGARTADAVREVARLTGVPRRRLYEAVHEEERR